MSIKDILVHVDHTQASVTRVGVAAKYAQQFDAHLLGVHAKPPLSYAYYQAAVDPQIVRDIEQEMLEQGDLSRQIFKNCETVNRDRSDFVEVSGGIMRTLINAAAACDVVVVGSAIDVRGETGIAGKVALGSGRPVIVVPDELVWHPSSRNVLVAWNGKKEAVRAVHDALPWLKTADTVKVLSVTDTGDTELSAHELAAHLAHHQVNVEVDQIQADDSDIADCLLANSADFNCHMMVMGAYGHSRLQELILGGTTQTILKSPGMPVLLSH